MNVLSLFDGISCGRIALERAGVKVDNYYASEVDKHAIEISKTNWKDVRHVGDVTKVSYKGGMLYTENGKFYVGDIGLILGGSPCQSISNLGDGSGLEGKSGLFYHYLRIRDEVMAENANVKFLLENVLGKKEAISEISRVMGVEPIMINSNLVSAQNRKRLYWTNIEGVVQPQDKLLTLDSALDVDLCATSVLTPGRKRWLESDKGQGTLAKRYATLDGDKAGCLTARSDASWNSNYVTRNGVVTKLSCTEYERLQNIPVEYTNCVANSQRYKAIGNGWTVDVIAHILRGILEPARPTKVGRVEMS